MSRAKLPIVIKRGKERKRFESYVDASLFLNKNPAYIRFKFYENKTKLCDGWVIDLKATAKAKEKAELKRIKEKEELKVKQRKKKEEKRIKAGAKATYTEAVYNIHPGESPAQYIIRLQGLASIRELAHRLGITPDDVRYIYDQNYKKGK